MWCLVFGLIGSIIFTLEVEAKLILFLLLLSVEASSLVSWGIFLFVGSCCCSSSCLIFGEESAVGGPIFSAAVCRLFEMSKLSWRKVLVRSTQREETLATFVAMSVALPFPTDLCVVDDGIVGEDLMIVALFMAAG